jgi:hypothetical protein
MARMAKTWNASRIMLGKSVLKRECIGNWILGRQLDYLQGVEFT